MPSPPPINPWLKQAFADLITERTGLKLRAIDQADLCQVLVLRMRSTGIDIPEQYYALLNSKAAESQAEWKPLVSQLTNSESFFFRDKGQFNLLRTTLLPMLLAQKRDKTLRICSAGCSTGEEPYSLAILLKTLLPDPEAWDIEILGVDIDAAAIAKAKAGIYRPWSFRGVETSIKQRFFNEVDNDYQVDPSIRSMVTFHTLNLLGDPFQKPTLEVKNIDLILCRNVFIYFSEAAIQAVIDKFYGALRPGGYLLVGHAELHSQNLTPFQVKVFDESVAYQRPSSDAAPDTAEPASAALPAASSYSRAAKLRNFNNLIDGRDTNIQQAALDLLRQLPADQKISRLDRTASELIAQLEEKLQQMDQ